MRGEGGAGQSCRVAVAGNRAWLKADSLVVGCRECPPSRSRSPIVGRIALTRTAVLCRFGAPSVRHRQLPPCATYPFSCYGRSTMICPLPLAWDSQPCAAPCLPRVYRLEVVGAVIMGEVYTLRHRRRCACRCCKFRHRGRRSCLRLLLLLRHLRFGDKPCQRSR